MTSQNISPSQVVSGEAWRGGTSLGLSLLDHGLNSSSPVSEELGINSGEGGISLSPRLCDSISVSFSVLVMVGVVLALCHFSYCCF